jgi:hypothetical protein
MAESKSAELPTFLHPNVEKKTTAAKLKKRELGGNEKLWIDDDDAPQTAKVGSHLLLAL